MKKAILKIEYKDKNRMKKAAERNGERLFWDAENRVWFWEGDGELPAFLTGYVIRIEEEKAEFTKADVMKRAWQIRKEAAIAMRISVSEVHFGECLRIAWAEFKSNCFSFSAGNAACRIREERAASIPRYREVENVDGGYQSYRY